MLDTLYQQLSWTVTPVIFLILSIVNILCIWGFRWRSYKLPGVIFFDGRHFGYGSDEAKAILEKMGSGGRWLYALTQVTLDLVYPFVYCGLFLILLGAGWRQPQYMRYLQLLPLATLVFDLLENFTTTYMTLSYDGEVSSVVHIASTFTRLKWLFVLLTFIAIVAGAFVFLAGWLSVRNAYA